MGVQFLLAHDIDNGVVKSVQKRYQMFELKSIDNNFSDQTKLPTDLIVWQKCRQEIVKKQMLKSNVRKKNF